MKITPLGGFSFGAVVEECTVQDVLRSASRRRALLNAFDTHSLLILPGQTDLAPAELMALAELFDHDAEAPIEQRAGQP